MKDTQPPFKIAAFTRNHVISGEVSLHDQRLSDYLNDRRTTMLSLRQASVARLNDPTNVMATFRSAILLKKSIALVFVPPQKDIPITRRFIGVVKEKHDVLVVIEGAEVRGIVHTIGPLDPQQILTSITEAFLPITQATISLTFNPDFILKQETVLVNVPEIRFIGEYLPPPQTQPFKTPPPAPAAQ